MMRERNGSVSITSTGSFVGLKLDHRVERDFMYAFVGLKWENGQL